MSSRRIHFVGDEGMRIITRTCVYKDELITRTWNQSRYPGNFLVRQLEVEGGHPCRPYFTRFEIDDPEDEYELFEAVWARQF